MWWFPCCPRNDERQRRISWRCSHRCAQPPIRLEGARSARLLHELRYTFRSQDTKLYRDFHAQVGDQQLSIGQWNNECRQTSFSTEIEGTMARVALGASRVTIRGEHPPSFLIALPHLKPRMCRANQNPPICVRRRSHLEDFICWMRQIEYR